MRVFLSGVLFNPAVTTGSQAWLAPTAVLTPRFVKIGAQVPLRILLSEGRVTFSDVVMWYQIKRNE